MIKVGYPDYLYNETQFQKRYEEVNTKHSKKQEKLKFTVTATLHSVTLHAVTLHAVELSYNLFLD